MLALKNNVIFVHIPKTGGRFVRQALRKLDVIDGSYGAMHAGMSQLNDVHKDCRKVATIRNPWAWYVSLYFFNEKMLKRKRFRRDEVIEIKDFEDFIKKSFDTEKTRRTHRFLWPGRREMKRDIGALTATMEYQCYIDGEDQIDYYLKLENAAQDFAEAFQIAPERLKEIDFDKKVGKTKHDPYKEYYSQELIDMVAHKERFIIEKFGYNW